MWRHGLNSTICGEHIATASSYNQEEADSHDDILRENCPCFQSCVLYIKNRTRWFSSVSCVPLSIPVVPGLLPSYKIRDTSYASVAASVFLAWDMLINIADEVEYIWRRPKGKMTWMYAFIRHMPILAQRTLIVTNTSNSTGVHFSSTGCLGWLSYQAAVMEVVTLAVEIVLITRVYALYNCNKIMLTAISTLFVLEVTAMITALCLSVPKMTFTPECLVSGAPAVFMAWWICSLAFETILFALTLVKFFRHVPL
ncbi:hypothetical protein A0H81_03315 [Grifola frondosa]|uniref:DUF6533 domain-containing protein n=1 Tax=Grifola frondosa TaxID=5627 RepID=A0A1C7MGQ7_GRIFR|nr:hypothetical protein A0H81_03315 [Grifola frondosa]